MMQGFLNIFQDSRKSTDIERITSFAGTTTETTTTTYGYLSDEQIKFAFNKIEKLLEERREKKRILSEKINKTSKLVMEYEKYLENLSHYTTETLKQMTCYMDEFKRYRETLKDKMFSLNIDKKP